MEAVRHDLLNLSLMLLEINTKNHVNNGFKYAICRKIYIVRHIEYIKKPLSCYSFWAHLYEYLGNKCYRKSGRGFFASNRKIE
ncbi:MAG: hypothetical protein ACD_7C00117G0002 [uncultured bacterium]|nr:MAG: hypothetical protein ACD_7C00117G0002 [uncultured bacterium]